MSTMIDALLDRVEPLLKGTLDGALQAKILQCLTDHLAAVFSAHGSAVDLSGRALLPMFGTGVCSLAGLSETSSAAGATFYNGLIATAEDMDDAHRFASGLHMSATTFPVLFALAETESVSGEQWMRAVAVGYEVSSRITRAADAGLRARGYHSTGAAGVFGACAAACALLGLDRETTKNALGIAASGAGGLFAFIHEGSSVRHAHGAWACLNGMTAARLAQNGLTGPAAVLEGYNEAGKDGFFAAYAEGWDERFIHEAGKPEIFNAYHKLHATCGHAAPAVTALQALREKVTAANSPIADVEIRCYKAAAALNNAAPRSVSEAKFSLPLITGIILRHGKATLSEMTQQTVEDAELQALAKRVRVVEDPKVAAEFPRLRSCELTVRLEDGQVFEERVEAPLGMPENPVGFDVIEGKFRNAAEGVFTKERQDALLKAIMDLPQTTVVDLPKYLRKN